MIDEDVELVRTELVSEAGSVIEDAIALGGEAGAYVFNEAGQERVVGGVEEIETEAGFDGGELSEHLLVKRLGVEPRMDTNEHQWDLNRR